MPLNIVRDDLVNMSADAIVLPSNERLIVDGGAGGAVARKAGFRRVRWACRKLGGCEVGSAVHTPAFSFPARYLIHAVGPVWQGGPEDAMLLRSAYDAALELALRLGCESIAMPLLSAGSFGCPVHVSLSIALRSIEAFLQEADLEVTLVLYDRRALAAGLEFLGEIESRIDDAYVESQARASRTGAFNLPAQPAASGSYAPDSAPFLRDADLPPARSSMSAASPALAPSPQHMPSQSAFPRERRYGERAASARGDVVDSGGFFDEDVELTAPRAEGMRIAADVPLEDRINNMDSGFSSTLLSIIDESGMTDAQVYRRANMSRQHFSKIRSNAGYRPSKATVLALCVALELDLVRTNDLLARAGFTLSHANKFDIIIEYFIEHGIYDPFKINETLFYFDQPLLGG